MIGPVYLINLANMANTTANPFFLYDLAVGGTVVGDATQLGNNVSYGPSAQQAVTGKC